MNMQAGSDECGALDDMTFATCELQPEHDGLHVGVNGDERVQWKDDANARAMSESESTAFAWEHMLPPLGSDVRVFGVDGEYYFRGQTAKLDLVIFSDNGIEAIRLRRDEQLCVVPWGRVDAIEWTIDS